MSEPDQVMESELRAQMARAASSNQMDRQRARIRLLAASQRRLANIMTTKIRTSFIGPLAVFERNFGHVWGHKLPETACTPEQLMERPIWEAVRQEILNNGNSQLRAAQAECLEYEVRWKGSTSLILKVAPETTAVILETKEKEEPR